MIARPRKNRQQIGKRERKIATTREKKLKVIETL